MTKIESQNNPTENNLEELVLIQSLKTIDSIFQKINIRNQLIAFQRIFQCSSQKKSKEINFQISKQVFSKIIIKWETILKLRIFKNYAFCFQKLFFSNLKREKLVKIIQKSKLEIALEEYKIEKYKLKTEAMKKDMENEKKGQMQLLLKMSEIVDAEINKND